MALAVDAPPVDVVAIVASAGGISAIERVLAKLPADLDAAVVILLHLMPQQRSMLPAILGRSTSLHVKQAEDGDELTAGTVYVAPPDAHLRVEGKRLRLDASELVHHVRPSADVLLFSLANGYKGRCLAVVLSGSGIDGAAGSAALKHAGGTVLAQDEATSQYFGMPGAAILAGGVDEVLALNQIGSAVVEFVEAGAA
jgi:two-component system chemotaxis response regulator CheB